MNPRHIIIDGRAYVWRELVKMRREQLQAHRTASGRYRQPSLLALLEA